MSGAVRQVLISQERCTQWLDASKSLLHDKDNLKKQKIDDCIEEFIETDSEFDSVSECGLKKRKLGFQLKSEELKMFCEWQNCNFQSKSLDSFVKHVSNHISELDIKITGTLECYVCLWNGCNYEDDDPELMKKHVNYHSYHTKIKTIGKNVRSRTKLPKCHQEKDWISKWDSLPLHVCDWDQCVSKSFSNYQLFLFHVSSHVENNPRGNNVLGGVNCMWVTCQKKYPNLYKLREHVRVHTREKVIACPDCGNMFANNTKFYNHCKRQISLSVQGFQCSHCNKFYPTKSILREHMRSHIFHYKCNLCHMSCDSPSSLSRHVLYRHSDTRNFPCNCCSHAAKTKRDLELHMNLHSENGNYQCHVEGCSYACKNAYSLDRHVEKIHALEIRWYCCHECPVRYKKSYRLTKHLIEAHNLQQITGHKRFQYIQEVDGYYRLQTIRYESVDENSMSDCINSDEARKKSYLNPQKLDFINIQNTNNPDENKIVLNKDGIIVNHPDQQKKSESFPNFTNILISIDEVDEHGNIIASKIVEAEEITELPPSKEPPVILTLINN